MCPISFFGVFCERVSFARAGAFLAVAAVLALPVAVASLFAPVARAANEGVNPAALKVRVGSAQDGGARFAGKVGRFTMFEALSAEDVRQLAAAPHDAPAPASVLNVRKVLLAGGALQFGAPAAQSGASSPAPASAASPAAQTVFPNAPRNIGAVEAWVFIEPEFRGNGRLFDRISVGGSDGWLLDLWPSTCLRLLNGDDALNIKRPLPKGKWVHVAAVFGDNAPAIFINGKRAAGSVVSAGAVSSDLTPPRHADIAWCSRPAGAWHEAFAIGNGRLGAMIFGSPTDERVSLNEDTLWSGTPRDLQKPGHHKYLPEIRRLLLAGKNDAAQKAINTKSTGMLGEWQESYMPLGDLFIKTTGENATGAVTDYRRELDFRTGVVTVSYTQNGARFKREYFASFPDQTIVVRLSADKPRALSFDAKLSTQLKTLSVDGYDAVEKPVGSALNAYDVVLTGNAPATVNVYDGAHNKTVYRDGEGTRFVEAIQAVAGSGKITRENNVLHVREADDVVIYFSAANNYTTPWEKPDNSPENTLALQRRAVAPLAAAVKKGFDAVRAAAVSDYQKYADRVRIEIPASERAKLPLEKRLRNFSLANDPSFAALYYQFGRHVLISGSRPGSQPLNLQGIWNANTLPPWASNWTLNCNAQINYWPVETANLSELHEPLWRLTNELAVDGAKTAKNLYNAGGWIAHHNADIWRTTWPVGGTGLWAIYQVGSAWLCYSIYDHFRFTGDTRYLAKIYPVLKGATQFYIDSLQPDNFGYLTTNPTTSFENTYKRPDGFRGWATAGAMQDIQIIRSLFKNTLQAAAVLGTAAGADADFVKRANEVLAKLPPNKVSPRFGDLQEWVEDWAAGDPGNGQNAHGWALSPDWDISPFATPELAEALRKTMFRRHPWTSQRAGSWVGAMSAGNFARLHDGAMVEKIWNLHVSQNTTPALIARFHGTPWQLDGNLGMTSALGESLFQSRPLETGNGNATGAAITTGAGVAISTATADAVPIVELHILPAPLPALKSGRITGLRARGGFEADITWDETTVTATIRSTWGKTARLRHAADTRTITFPAGKNSPAQTFTWKR